MPHAGEHRFVYLDYAATAPLCEEAAQAMAPFQVPGAENLIVNANPNSLHSLGRAAFAALEAARKTIATGLGARRPNEICFTSGATEADNAALFGMAEGAVDARRLKGKPVSEPHIVVSSIEHDAVLAPARRLEARGYRVTRLRPNADGFIESRVLEDALDESTVLVSIQMANSEIGSIQAVRQLAAMAHEAGALFHTDAVQALGKVPLSLRDLGVDAASFSAHKIGGPRGIGALYLKDGTPFVPMIWGGGQEHNLRSGTQNVAGAVGFAAACQAAQEKLPDESDRLRDLRDELYLNLGRMDGIQATVDVEPGSLDYLPHIVHILVDHLESDTLILRFDQLGFAVSGGSACSSASLEPSHVLTSIGIHPDLAQNALRISMGSHTTREDVDAFLLAVPRVLSW